MTVHRRTGSSVSSNGLVVNPDSLTLAVTKHNDIEELPVTAGRGVSNITNWKIQDPLFVKVVSTSKNGDRMEFRNRGTKFNYRHTFNQDGTLRESHKINFPCFVLIRSYNRNPNKTWNKVRRN